MKLSYFFFNSKDKIKNDKNLQLKMTVYKQYVRMNYIRHNWNFSLEEKKTWLEIKCTLFASLH